MPRKAKRTHVLVLGKWAVEETSGRYKVKLLGTSQGFTLEQKGQAKWRASGISSLGSSRKQVRKIFTAKDLEEALDHGGRLVLGVMPEVRVDEHPHLTIAEVLAEAIKTGCHGQDEWKRKLASYAGYFIEFCEGRRLRLWEEIRHAHVGEYVKYLQEDDLARPTIKNYIHVVGFATRYAVRNHQDHYRDFWMHYSLPDHIGQSGEYDDEDGLEALSIGEVLDLYDWLDGHRWGDFLRPGVLLGGLVGLRVREIVYLTWPNVLIDDGCIVIQNEEGHMVKNKYSVRKLPVPNLVLEALDRVPRSTGRVLKVEANKSFNWDRMKSFLESLSYYYGVCLNKALREWRPGTSLTGKALRRTLQTEALEAIDWPVHLVDRYVGHAPRTVMERHYFGDKKRKLVERYRELVLPKIEQKITAARGVGEVQNSTKLHFSGSDPESAGARIIDMADVAS